MPFGELYLFITGTNKNVGGIQYGNAIHNFKIVTWGKGKIALYFKVCQAMSSRKTNLLAKIKCLFFKFLASFRL